MPTEKPGMFDSLFTVRGIIRMVICIVFAMCFVTIFTSLCGCSTDNVSTASPTGAYVNTGESVRCVIDIYDDAKMVDYAWTQYLTGGVISICEKGNQDTFFVESRSQLKTSYMLYNGSYHFAVEILWNADHDTTLYISNQYPNINDGNAVIIR